MQSTELLVAIQHHPSRAGRTLERLLERLVGLDVTVVTDGNHPPDPWRGHRACLEIAWARLETISHLVVVQDDAIPCPNFACEIQCAIDAEPAATLALYLAAHPRLTAQQARLAFDAGERFVRLNPRDHLPVVAVCYPAAHVGDILDWCDQDRGRRSRSDDFMLGRWHRERSPRVLCTVPSLVDHPDDVPSVIGNGTGGRGLNGARCAMFVLEADPLRADPPAR